METIIKNAKDANIQASNFQTLRTEEFKESLKFIYETTNKPLDILHDLKDFKMLLMAASKIKENYSGDNLKELPEDIQRLLNLFNADLDNTINTFNNIEALEYFVEGFSVECKVRNDEFNQLTKDF